MNWKHIKFVLRYFAFNVNRTRNELLCLYSMTFSHVVYRIIIR